MHESHDDAITAIAGALRLAGRVAVLTGAGMSVESGLPTYRGIGGLYNAVEVEAGMPIEEILHAYTLARNPALTWKYIAQIHRAGRGAVPNDGHRLLAAWESRFELWVVTQNVDGLHRAAGSTRVLELHGNLRQLFCCDCRMTCAIDDIDPGVLPPRCRHCDGLVRPDVVLFGELLPAAALSTWQQEQDRGFDVMFAIGTSATFPYVYEPVVAASRGCVTVEINPDTTPLSRHVRHHLRRGAGAALREIDDALSRT